MTFKIINESNASELAAAIADELRAEREEIAELFCSFNFDSDAEFAVCAAGGCVLVRVQDFGRYSFLFPFEFSAAASLSEAVDCIAEYSMREEIPLVFFDVPRDAVSLFLSLGFKHLNIDARDADGESFRVEIKSECELLDEIPTVSDDILSLTGLREEDIPEYARISREPTALRYWGYDYREDAPNADDGYFYSVARRDFLMGASMSLAVRMDGALIGEVQIYAFDRKGGAEFAVRLLPEYRGRGLGKRTLDLVFELVRLLWMNISV